MSSILVLGVGNTLMSDDGAGVRLLEQLQAQDPPLPGVDYVDAGTLSFVLLPRIQGCRALLILDAAHLGEPTGTTRCFTGTAMDEFLSTARCSVHEVGIRDLLDMARLTDSLPERRAFIGIQPGETGWGESLSDDVSRALPVATLAARSVIESWIAGGASQAQPR